MTLPWLPTTSSTRRLEADLKERGWRVWWTQAGSVKLFSPSGDTIEISEPTPAQTIRNAYASAQEYSNAQTGEQLREAQDAAPDVYRHLKAALNGLEGSVKA